MKQTFVLIAAAIIGFSTPVLAQSDDNETEITVTNAEGKKEIIDLPEAMTNEYDSLLSVYNNRTYLNINTDCNMPDVNPVYSKEVYKERLARIPSVIELPYNDVVQKFIDRYSGRLRRSVSIMLGAQNFYMPTFEEALESYGLPLELKYLPVIESALNPNAVSHVGATGLWQFMLTTGKQYGLEINSLVDVATLYVPRMQQHIICATCIRYSATGISLSQHTTADQRISTRQYTAQTVLQTIGRYIHTCQRKQEDMFRRLSPQTI